MIVTLTGPSGCGKTTVCGTLAKRARSRGLSVAGLLTVPRVTAGVVSGLDVEDLGTGEVAPLAEREAATDGPATEHWSFHRQGIAWGVRRLALAAGTDLFIIDEIGPLELLRGEGWADAIDALSGGGHRLAVAVVRPELIDRFLARLGGRPSRQLVVSAANRDAIPDVLLAQLADAR